MGWSTLPFAFIRTINIIVAVVVNIAIVTVIIKQ